MRKLIWLFLFVAAGCSSAVVENIPSGDEPVPVKVISVSQEVVYEPIHASGSFTTDDEAIRAFKTGGIIQRMFVREGDAIKKGQLLATLDLTEISAQVTQATLAYEKANRDHSRVTNLYRDSVVTLEMYENSGTALQLAREQLTAARFNLTYSEIRATEDGFVLKKFVNEGQVVGPGTPVYQTNGAGDGDWILRVAVSDGQWSNISTGDAAMITTDAGTSQPLSGKVTKKSEGVDPWSGTFTIDITPAGNQLKSIASGMFGKAVITPSSGRKVWKIPYEALLDGDGNTGFVFVACDPKKAVKQKVSIAALTRDHVLIDQGLEQCQEVITTGNAYLTDQSPITLIK